MKRGVRRRPESTYAQESAVAVQTKSSWVSWWRPEANSARNVPRCPQRKRVNLYLDRVHRISQTEPPISNRLTCADGHGGPPLRRGLVSKAMPTHVSCSTRCIYHASANVIEVRHRHIKSDHETKRAGGHSGPPLRRGLVSKGMSIRVSCATRCGVE